MQKKAAAIALLSPLLVSRAGGHEQNEASKATNVPSKKKKKFN